MLKLNKLVIRHYACFVSLVFRRILVVFQSLAGFKFSNSFFLEFDENGWVVSGVKSLEVNEFLAIFVCCVIRPPSTLHKVTYTNRSASWRKERNNKGKHKRKREGK